MRQPMEGTQHGGGSVLHKWSQLLLVELRKERPTPETLINYHHGRSIQGTTGFSVSIFILYYRFLQFKCQVSYS